MNQRDSIIKLKKNFYFISFILCSIFLLNLYISETKVRNLTTELDNLRVEFNYLKAEKDSK